jgi:FAD:protein FMN transferase
MGIRAGMHLVNQLHYMACIIIDDNDQLYTSNNIKLV